MFATAFVGGPAVAAEPAPPATLEEALTSGNAANGIEFGITGPAVVSSDTTTSRFSAAASYDVKCTATIDEPHYSSGAGGAIYKTRVTCTGYGLSSVSVKVKGLLQYDYATSSTDTSNIVWQDRASSSQTQSVVVNGAAKTFYTPLVGQGHGGRGTGFWYATSTYQVTSPSQSNVSSKSYLIFKTI